MNPNRSETRKDSEDYSRVWHDEIEEFLRHGPSLSQQQGLEELQTPSSHLNQSQLSDLLPELSNIRSSSGESGQDEDGGVGVKIVKTTPQESLSDNVSRVEMDGIKLEKKVGVEDIPESVLHLPRDLPSVGRGESGNLSDQGTIGASSGSIEMDEDGKKKKRLTCNQCGQTFGRLEHLKRHKATHTGQRKFECEQCGRLFARNDDLLRHSRLH